MAIHDQQDGQEPTLPALSTKGAARRRFAKAGLGASGVLLTLQSQPGMAADLLCRSPSGFLSGNLTSLHGKPPTCNGVTPGYWKNHPEAWPNGYTPFNDGKKKATLYRQCYTVANPGPGAATPNYFTISLMDIMSHQDFDNANIGMHLAAAWLNAVSGKVSMPTTAILTAIWNEYTLHGYYTPVAGVHWDATAIVDYLKSSMPL